MRAIRKTEAHKGRCIPNVLPCRINRNGLVNASNKYWNATKTPDGKKVVYFRGRKLHGRHLRLPVGYKGVVLSATDDILSKEDSTNDEAEEADEEPEDDGTGVKADVKIMKEQSAFDEIMVWGHEAVMDESDPYVRGMEEWIGFAEQIHSFDSDKVSASNTTE